MKSTDRNPKRHAALLLAVLIVFCTSTPRASGYVFNFTVGDLRQPLAQSGGSACPHRNRFEISPPNAINRQWSTFLGTAPVTVLTQDQTSAGRLNEIERVMLDSFATWTNVNASSMRPVILAPLARMPARTACSGTDGLNTICFDQDDAAFTPGVLAFTRVVTADAIGVSTIPGQPPSAFVGQILDADILVRGGDASVTFATPAALPSQPNAYDLESVLTHEIGHVMGLAHSAVWSATMYPFVPERGEFLGDRPGASAPDAPLADDDRTGMRALYPDPSDTTFVGSISGRVLPANPFSLADDPSGVTGVFGAQVVALDSASGTVVAAALSGWSCIDPGPPTFDGSYVLERLPVGAGRSYRIYAEPLDGTVDPSEIATSISALCRNQITDPAWPVQFSCIVPQVVTNFSVRVRP